MQDHGAALKLVEEALLASASKSIQGVTVEQLFAITRRKLNAPSSKEELRTALQGSARFDIQNGKVYLPMLRLADVFLSEDDLCDLVELTVKGGLRKLVSSNAKTGVHEVIFWDFRKAREAVVKLNQRTLVKDQIVVTWASPRPPTSRLEEEEEERDQKTKEAKKQTLIADTCKGSEPAESNQGMDPEAVAGLLKEMQLKIEREKTRAYYEAKLRRVAELNLEEFKIQDDERRRERNELFGAYATTLIGQKVEPLVGRLDGLQSSFAAAHGQLKCAFDGLAARDVETQELVEGLRRHFESVLHSRDKEAHACKELFHLEVQTLRTELAELRKQVGLLQLKDQQPTEAKPQAEAKADGEAEAVVEAIAEAVVETEAGDGARSSGEPSAVLDGGVPGDSDAHPETEALVATEGAGDTEKCDPEAVCGSYV